MAICVRNADTVGTMCDFDRSDRILAAAHAFQEILHVVCAAVEPDLTLARLLT